MPRINIPHERQGFLLPTQIRPNTTSVIELDSGQIYNEVMLQIWANFEGAGQSDEYFGGILNLIKSISINVNGSDTISRLEGADLAALYMVDWAREARVYIDANAGDVGVVAVPLTFLLARTNGVLNTGLDLRKRVGSDPRVTIRIEWGSEHDVWMNVGEKRFTGGNLECATVTKHNVPDTTPIQYVRDFEVTEKEILANDDNAIIIIPKRQGAIIGRIFTLETYNGQVNQIINNEFEVVVDRVTRFSARADLNNERESALRNFELPPGIKVIDLLSYGDIGTAELSDNLDDDIRFHVEVARRGPGISKVRYIVEYIRAFREN